MAERYVDVKAGGEGVPPSPESIGRAFACGASIWRIKGMYLTPTLSGGRELWWILGEQEIPTAGIEGGECE